MERRKEIEKINQEKSSARIMEGNWEDNRIKITYESNKGHYSVSDYIYRRQGYYEVLNDLFGFTNEYFDSYNEAKEGMTKKLIKKYSSLYGQ